MTIIISTQTLFKKAQSDFITPDTPTTNTISLNTKILKPKGSNKANVRPGWSLKIIYWAPIIALEPLSKLILNSGIQGEYFSGAPPITNQILYSLFFCHWKSVGTWSLSQSLLNSMPAVWSFVMLAPFTDLVCPLQCCYSTVERCDRGLHQTCFFSQFFFVACATSWACTSYLYGSKEVCVSTSTHPPHTDML